MKFYLSVPMLLVLVQVARSIVNGGEIEAFKDALANTNDIRQLTWSIVDANDLNNPRYFTAAASGSNFFIRQFAPNENIQVHISPTNMMRIHYFYGRAGIKKWEISGMTVYETEESTNSVAVGVANARQSFDAIVTLGLGSRAKDWKWNGNEFIATRDLGSDPAGPKLVKIERRVVKPNGDVQVSYPDLKSLQGELYVSNGVPARIDFAGASIYYTFASQNGALPNGIPDTVTICERNKPPSDYVRIISILKWEIAPHLQAEYFMPYRHISPEYLGIIQRSGPDGAQRDRVKP